MQNTLSDPEYAEAREILRDSRFDPARARDALGAERFVAWMATHGLKDLYFFCKAILGFKDLVPHLHGELCRFGDRFAPRRKGYLVPRGHLKSSCITIGKNTWRLMQDPLQRRAIFHEKSTQAIQFLDIIKHHLTTNELLKALYPERIPPFKSKSWRWTQDAINIPRPQEYAEPSIYVAGQSAALQGMHFTAMTWDDLIGEEAAGNSEIMQKVIDWMIRAEALSVTPDTLELDLIGTRWAYWDIYAWAKQSYSSMEWIEKSAITKNDRGEDAPLWPERFSMELLMELQRRDFVSFSNQYLNTPTTGDRNEFEPEHLRYYTRDTRVLDGIEQAVVVQEDERESDGSLFVPLSHLTVYLQCDPGLGIVEGSRKAVSRHSRSAITVVGTAWPRRVFLLEVWAKRVGVDEFIDQILRYFKAYERQCRAVVIEKHSWTRIVKAPLLSRAREQGIELTEGRIVDYTKSGNQSKDGRIRSLKPYFANGQVFLSRAHTELEREYRDFPLGKSKDILDALCQGPSGDIWRFSEDEEESPWDEWGKSGEEDEVDRVKAGASALTGY